MPSILKSKNTMSKEEKFTIIKTIIESDLKIAFNINDIETTYFVEEAFMSVFRQYLQTNLVIIIITKCLLFLIYH